MIVNESSLENILNENYKVLNDNERRDSQETDDDTTSLENADLDRPQSKKKLKGSKKFVRSNAQQKHHLEYQESEEQPEIVEITQKAFASQNTAFDELFAAANTGNFIKSAHVEAKMAIAASKKAADNEANQQEQEQDLTDTNNRFPYNLNYKKRGTSFINRSSTKRVQPTDTVYNKVVTGNSDIKKKVYFKNIFQIN